MKTLVSTWLYATAVLCSTCFAATAADGINLAVIDQVIGANGDWDYASIDDQHRRLYIARENGVDAFNLDKRTWQAMIVPGAAVRGVLAVGADGLFASSNAKNGTVTVFEGETGAIRGSVKVGQAPDALFFEPKSGLLGVVGGESGDITLVDPMKLAAVATIHIGGKLEFAVVDDAGKLFVNVQSAHSIAVIDIGGRKVQRRFGMRNCTSPTGLGYSAAAQLLVSACENGVAKILSSIDGHDVATVPIGKGADAVIIDTQRNWALIPCGDSGTLSVIQLAGGGGVKLLGTVKTQVGARTGALDVSTGRVYLPTADFGPPVPPSRWPSIKPGTFRVLIVGRR
jgi:DNA-binding beta-propeller fold protein YncE